MPAIIEIVDGTYKIRGQDVSMAGFRFELVEGFKTGAQGGYVTVAGGSVQPSNAGIPDRAIRIKCEGTTSYLMIAEGAPAAKVDRPGVKSLEQIQVSDASVAHESDEQIVERLRSRFQVLQDMTQAVKAGTVRAMIVTGPPGVGKSFGVEEVLSRQDLFNTLGNKKPKYEIVKGAMSALGLYSKLYEFSERGNVVVFDDCDSVLLDDLSLNILKAALDSSKKRTIAWNTDSRLLRQEGVPDRFEFKAGAIFITNIKFEHVKSKRLRDHLDALESRCHYIDLQMDTNREKILRIKQVVNDNDMLARFDFEQLQKDEIVEFVEANQDRLRELSLRMVLKLADLRKGFPKNWQAMAKTTCMKRA